MKRQVFIATAVLALFFGVGLMGRSSKASDHQTLTQRPRKVVMAITEDFKGSSKILYFSEDENGVRTPFAEGELPTRAELNIMSATTSVKTVGVISLGVMPTNYTTDPMQQFSVAEIQEAMFGDGPDSLASRLRLNSYGRVILTGRVFNWVTIPPPVDAAGKPYTGCDRGYFANDIARQANGAVGFDHYMVIVPPQADCEYGGFADIIGSRWTLYGNIDTRSALHELGHNFGLLHSRYINYSGSQPINTTSCFDISYCEYGDVLDIMGTGNTLFHTFTKVKLGWIPSSDVATVDAANHDQTVVLSAGEQNLGTRDITVPLDDGTGYSYHIEYRCCDYYLPGVFVRLNRPNSETEIFNSYLVPGQQGNASDPNTSALKLPGQVYVDATHQVRMELLGLNGSQATVHVTVPAAPLPHISEVSYGGGKKLVVLGENFGENARLFINGVDVSDSVTWKVRADGKLKLKAPTSVFGFRAGSNTVQVMTSSGSAMSNLVVVTL